MSSFKPHGFREVKKQLNHRMKRDGLDTINVEVTCASGKHKVDFTGEDLSRLGSGERNLPEAKARRAERAGASQSTPGWRASKSHSLPRPI